MKNHYSILGKISVAVLSLAMLQGCNKSDDKFGFSSNSGGYVIQQYSSGIPSFRPYMKFGVNHGNLATGTISLKGVPLAGGTIYDNLYETYAGTYPSISHVNGTYTFSAVSEKGEEASASITFNIDKVLGEMTVHNFVYENGKIKAEIENVENAIAYGFLINPVIPGLPSESRFFSTDYTFYPESGSVQKPSMSYSFPNTDYDAVRVYPLAVYAYDGVLALIGEEKILRKGATAFD